MRLAALVDSPDHVCCRYRLAAFRSLLARAGHSLELISFPRSFWSRLCLGSGLKDFDAVILQRRLLPWWPLRQLRRNARRLLFDLDDAVYLRDSYHPRGLHDPRKLARFAALCRSADAIMAGNGFLAAEARRQRARTVHVIPTCVDHHRYPLALHQRAGKGVELVWVGSASTLQGLKQIAPLLESIGRGCSGVRLKLICNAFFRLEHLPTLEVAWSEAREGADLAGADIGIGWVPDDDWSRGKCGLKVLQYMAAGLPVIANPVSVHTEMVRHGETGFLASTQEEWVEAVRTLVQDPDLRRRMGQAGRKLLERSYSVEAGAEMWSAALAELEQQGSEREKRCLPSSR